METNTPGHRLRTLTQGKSGLGSRSLISNAGLTGSVAAGGTGNSNCATAQSGGVTAAYSIQATVADAGGNTWGNEVKIVATATGAGTCSLILALDRTNFAAGDLINGGCEIDVADGTTGLQGAACNLEWYLATGGTVPVHRMFPSGIGLDSGGHSGFCMEPPPLKIGSFAGQPYTNIALRLTFNAAGSATVIVRKIWAER